MGKQNKRRIPVASKVDATDNYSPKLQGFTPHANCITFSFGALEYTEYFNLDGTCQNWTSDLFKMMKDVSQHTENELRTGQLRTYRFHTHENAHPPSPLPEKVDLKDFSQIRISKSKGGIHGVLKDSVFYVMWLDPLHNMYPDDRFGGLRKIQPPNTCCKDMEEENVALKKQISDLEEELRTYKELLS